MRHLRKEYPSEGAPLVAVKDLSVNMYEGQIFALVLPPPPHRWHRRR